MIGELYDDKLLLHLQLKSSIKERLKLIQPAVTEEDSEYVASGILKVETQLNSVRQCLVFTICIHNNIIIHV